MNAAVELVNLPGYRPIEQLHCGSKTIVYRAIREADHHPVVIKLLRRDYPTFSDLLQFRNQYTIAQNLNVPGIIRPDRLESHGNIYALIMEDFGGISLREYTHQALTLIEVLAIALQLTIILHDLYQHRIIHKDIKPANILIHPQTKQIKLIDFSIASLLPKETEALKHPNVLEGTLAYLAPEQTGRMNRGIDYRADFYALGVTLFELLTGQLPFQTDDPLELVHCHIAKPAPSIAQLKPEIPAVIGQIVAKLMAKNAEDRYQSALGLKYDLETCLHQLKETGVAAFEIAARDVSDRFLIPEKLYGREPEVQTLLAAFERVSNGTSELILVAGGSGIGKTAVVHEVHKPLVKGTSSATLQQRGYFIKGKFDQFNRNIPFSAFVQAFRDLTGQLLSESDTQLQSWKAQILAALGENGQVIIDVIPELEQVIGPQPVAAKLSGTAAQNRFNLLFQKFIQVFTTPQHPVVMFLDDLQWADSASLNLVQQLMASESGYLLLIGAYRDNEVFAAHPLMISLDTVIKAGAVVNTIVLQPLNQASLNHLIADTLHCDTTLAQPLTELIYQRTQGNPFFATQFLKALHQDGLIQFDSQAWQCDIARVRSESITDDVVEFMTVQLQKLPQATQESLKFAACIGNQFDLATLAIVSERSHSETAANLWDALQEGFILPQSEVYKFYVEPAQTEAIRPQTVPLKYKFLHDRVQQAAYSLIPTYQKQAVHDQIGQLLLRSIPEANREDHIFDIVSQLNAASELMTQHDRQTLAQLNLIASRKAFTATAYAAAIKYSKLGIELLANHSWQNQYNLTLDLHQIATESAYLSGELEQMNDFANLVITQARTPLDQVSVYAVKIEALTAQGQLTEAIAAGIAILEQLGVDLPFAPTQADITAAMQAFTTAMGKQTPIDLLDRAETTDITIHAAARILMTLSPTAYLSQPLMYILVVLKKIYLSVAYGHEPTAPFSYAAYSIVASSVLEDVELGYQFGQLALDLLPRQHHPEIEVKTLYPVYAFSRHWKHSLHETLHPLRTVYSSSLNVGDLIFAGYSAYTYGFYSFFAGQPLTQLESEIADYCEALKHLKQSITLTYSQLLRQVLLNLICSDESILLSGAAYDEQQQLSQHQAATDRTGLALLWIHKLILSYLFSAPAQAVEQAQQARPYLDAVAAYFFEPIFYFYESLANLAVEQSLAIAPVEANQEKLRYWATHAPMNFQHKYDLVEAERHRVLGQRSRAIDLYDRAIAGAKEHCYLQEEALANELAAKFYLDWGKEKVAASYLQEAYYCYARWGAKAKTDDLETRYSRLLQPILQATQSFAISGTLSSIDNVPILSNHSKSASSANLNNALDLAALLQVSQALSRTIQLDELLEILTQTMLENSGADRGALILCQNDQWQVRAIADLEQTTLQSTPLENNPAVPIKLIQYIKNTLTAVVIDNLDTDLPVIGNYLNQHQPRSVLCLPILNQGKLIGILYLENRATSGVFTSDRLLVLDFLLTQATIALENARLYRAEQEKNQALERSEARIRSLIERSADAILLFEPEQLVFTECNQAALDVIGFTHKEQLIGLSPLDISPEFQADGTPSLEAAIHAIQLSFKHGSHRFEWLHQRVNGDIIWIEVVLTLMNFEDKPIFQCVWRDISDRKAAELAIEHQSQELQHALQDLQQAQLQLIQNEKMSALGNLVAGVAHEINNPVGCIVGNVSAVQESMQDLFSVIDLYREKFPQPGNEIEAELDAIDLDYLREDLPKLIKAMKDGGDRIKSISKSLRTFSRADSDSKQKFNLHHGIDSTVLILRHRLKANEQRPEIKVVVHYGDLPDVECFPGQLNQVFMNILANAIDALDEFNQGRSFAEIAANPNQITIRTAVVGEQVTIAIADNGSGIPENVRSRIFDHLFTTKGVGKGTGLGLAIAQQIVVEKHYGSIKVNSEVGKGTEFVISLPL